MSLTISIITPTYNRAYTLPNLIESVINQTYKDWELLIVDDGSIDNTRELVNSYRDRRIRYFYKANGGSSSARNFAISYVRGQLIAYLDSDNEYYPQYLETVSRYIKNNKNCKYALPKGKRTIELYDHNKLNKIIDDSKDFLDNITIKDIFCRNFHFDINGFVHSKDIFNNGIFWDENLKLMEDWDFGMQIVESYPEDFLYVPETLYNYHQRFGLDGVISNAKYCDCADSFEYIYQKHKSSIFIQEQTWYPNRVNKYKKLEEDYRNGSVLCPYEYFFSEKEKLSLV